MQECLAPKRGLSLNQRLERLVRGAQTSSPGSHSFLEVGFEEQSPRENPPPTPAQMCHSEILSISMMCKGANHRWNLV